MLTVRVRHQSIPLYALQRLTEKPSHGGGAIAQPALTLPGLLDDSQFCEFVRATFMGRKLCEGSTVETGLSGLTD